MPVQSISEPNGGETQISPRLRVKLAAALDSVTELIASDESRLFETDGSRNRFLFDLFAARKKRSRKPRPCVFPGCANISVPASHALQRNGPLAAIAEENHVLTPQVRAGKLNMSRVGIGEASTFPGFCLDHEALFFALEHSRTLALDEHVALQVFRATCREIVIKRQQVETVNYTVQEWRKVVSERGIALVAAQLGKFATELPPLRGLTVSGVGRYENTLVREQERITRDLKLLEDSFLPNAVKDRQEPGAGLAHFVLRIGQFIPMCLAGMGTFAVREGDQIQEVSAVLNVWPTPTDVTISMAVLPIHEQHLRAYLAMQLKRSLGALEMIETWMVNGSDHWFIRPSVWKRIPSARQERILADIIQAKHNIGTPYSLSVFDSVREEMLTLPDEETHPPTDREGERSKLAAFIPAVSSPSESE